MATVTLYRPVGQIELDLIEASGWRAFPPRLDWQPIFYPVTTLEYATFIAREWNTKDPANGSVGYVTSFDVDAVYLTQFGPQLAGGRDFQEYWVPAEELDAFNEHVAGPIRLVAEYR
jgi:hypothetical protein